MTDYQPNDRGLLGRCKIDLGDEAVKAEYLKLRQVYTWMGQVGGLPLPVLVEFVRRHGEWATAAPAPSPIPTPEEPETVKSNGKAKAAK
jgi:hypothetical protein